MIQDIRVKFVTDDKDLDKTERKFKDISAAEKKVGDDFTKAGKTIEKESGNMAATLGKVGGVIAAAFTLDKIIQFQKQVIATTAEFQKFSAVLTNTLGSKSDAQLALASIVDFASKTPFSVQQLTASFVKLANQGFKPTTEELRKLGDLAASTGKEFDQLTEAIIDAQTGEFERLKEFGIRASKEGDKVTFTFKGIQTQADFTSASIRNYILSLGDAEGVSGSMAAISETLGGKISNLGDSFDQLLVAIGTKESGFISSMLNATSEMINQTAAAIELSNKLDQLGLSASEKGQLNNQRLQKTLEESREIISQYNLEFEDEALKARNALQKLIADRADLVVTGQLWEEQFEIEKALIRQAQSEIEDIRKLRRKQSADAEILAQENLSESLKKIAEDRVKDEKETLDELDKLYKQQIERIKNRDKEISAQQQRQLAIEKDSNEQARVDMDAEAQAEILKMEEVNRLKGELYANEQALRVERFRAIEDISGSLLSLLDTRFGEERMLAGLMLAVSKASAIANVITQAAQAKAMITAQAATIPITIAPGVPNPAYPIAQANAAVQAQRVNFGTAAALVAIGAQTIGEIKRLKKGEIDIKGPGTSTSDSIPALLSRGESVFTAEETRLFRPTFEAIRQKRVPPELLNETSTGFRMDYDRLGGSFDRSVRRLPLNQFSFDERGFTRYTIRENSRIQRLNKRYGL